MISGARIMYGLKYFMNIGDNITAEATAINSFEVTNLENAPSFRPFVALFAVMDNEAMRYV